MAKGTQAPFFRQLSYVIGVVELLDVAARHDNVQNIVDWICGVLLVQELVYTDSKAQLVHMQRLRGLETRGDVRCTGRITTPYCSACGQGSRWMTDEKDAEIDMYSES